MASQTRRATQILFAVVGTILPPGLSSAPVRVAIEFDQLNVLASSIGTPRSCDSLLPALSPASGCGNVVIEGRVLSVNSQEFSGTLIARVSPVKTPSTVAGASTPSVSFVDIALNILQRHRPEGPHPDGFTPVGTLFCLGTIRSDFTVPSDIENLSADIGLVSGTMSLAGLQGYVAVLSSSGSGHLSIDLRVHSDSRPAIVSTPVGPAIARRMPRGLVSERNPARRGEVLEMVATDLGPTRSCMKIAVFFPFCADSPMATPMERHLPFPGLEEHEQHVAAAPVSVVVDGIPAEIWYVGGYRSSFDYQVNFEVPSNVHSGRVTLQIFRGWIPSDPVEIVIQ